MAGFKSQQHHLSISGRDFHFVSYEGQLADARKNLLPQPSMWYLMCEGRRWPAAPCEQGQSLEAIDDLLRSWAEANAVGKVDRTPATEPKAAPALGARWENWWGPS